MVPLPDQQAFPLSNFRSWQPFRLDALGLVTLLGADEVANALGSLNHNIWTDYLPVFGSFKVASDQIATVTPGYSLYNLSDGIWVTELAPWFTRWLSVNLKHNYTVLEWNVEQEARSRPKSSWFAMVLGFVVNGGLLVLACVQADWYGIANAASMIFSVWVKLAICQTYRKVINEQGRGFNDKRAEDSTVVLPSRTPVTIRKKLLVVLPDGKLAIGYLPVGIVPMMLDRKSKPLPWRSFLSFAALKSILPTVLLTTKGKTKAQPNTFRPFWRQLKLWSLRAIGWLGFGIQIVAIGQATLLTQICTVAVMTLASVATIYNVGVINEAYVGRWMTIRQYEADAKGRQDAYVMLEPNQQEQDYMCARGLLPDKRNAQWYDGWRAAKETWASTRKSRQESKILNIPETLPAASSANEKMAASTISRATSQQALAGSQRP